MTTSEKHEYAKVCMLLRIALTGSTISPNIFEVAAILGKEEVLGRIDDCLRLDHNGETPGIAPGRL